ncbi:MAG: YHS domain-containing (seleno)protein [Hydrogenophaga sp.]
MTRLARTLFGFALAALLAGCGTRWATVPDGAGRPLMLLGHDPVTYFTEGKPRPGQPAFTSNVLDRSYRFASAQNRLDFTADPARYEPQYGGFCAHGAAFGRKLGSNPTLWAVRDGRLYLFGSRAAQAAWSLEPQRYINRADALWVGLQDRGWRTATFKATLLHERYGQALLEARADWERQHPGQAWPDDAPTWRDGIKLPGWRAAEGVGQPALGYPD